MKQRLQEIYMLAEECRVEADAQPEKYDAEVRTMIQGILDRVYTIQCRVPDLWPS